MSFPSMTQTIVIGLTANQMSGVASMIVAPGSAPQVPYGAVPQATAYGPPQGRAATQMSGVASMWPAPPQVSYSAAPRQMPYASPQVITLSAEGPRSTALRPPAATGYAVQTMAGPPRMQMVYGPGGKLPQPQAKTQGHTNIRTAIRPDAVDETQFFRKDAKSYYDHTAADAMAMHKNFVNMAETLAQNVELLGKQFHRDLDTCVSSCARADRTYRQIEYLSRSTIEAEKTFWEEMRHVDGYFTWGNGHDHYDGAATKEPIYVKFHNALMAENQDDILSDYNRSRSLQNNFAEALLQAEKGCFNHTVNLARLTRNADRLRRCDCVENEGCSLSAWQRKGQTEHFEKSVKPKGGKNLFRTKPTATGTIGYENIPLTLNAATIELKQFYSGMPMPLLYAQPAITSLSDLLKSHLIRVDIKAEYRTDEDLKPRFPKESVQNYIDNFKPAVAPSLGQ